MIENVEWKLEKPNKTGYWMWKIPNHKNITSGIETFCVSYFDIEKQRVYSCEGDVDYYDSWWNSDKPLYTYYIGK